MQTSSKVPFVLMRGGTSKGIFLREEHVPADRDRLTAFTLDLMGSPDKRQIDGLGGADKLTSKLAVIGKPRIPGTDLTYLFGQVGILAAEVDYKPNCGNLTSGVAMYALQEGIVPSSEGWNRVRIHNLNTDKIINADILVRDGEPVVEGELAIGGVPGTGSPIGLDFSAAAGAITGKLLPLGGVTSTLQVDGYPDIEVSVVDCANLVIFCRAADLGMRGTELPAEIDANPALVAHIDAIRGTVARRVGMGEYWASRKAPALPMLWTVQRPTSYTAQNGAPIDAAAIDLVCRSYATGTTHQAVPVTATSCAGVAASLPGSIPNQLLGRGNRGNGLIEIGHPSGVIKVEGAVEAGAGGEPFAVRTAKIFRTARRLADGTAYLHRPHG
ncbi:2-methylaconitate cis-trans isomerase PrpF family protein [Pigmentiphaga soli]|uniref:2-methylaconitate cis-trans isomerase PrpF family protein n=1 Tax=Pigmentiphaga soli TaxID=1007095 RepID=A0ABP8H8R1_9BURK